MVHLAAVVIGGDPIGGGAGDDGIGGDAGRRPRVRRMSKGAMQLVCPALIYSIVATSTAWPFPQGCRYLDALRTPDAPVGDDLDGPWLVGVVLASWYLMSHEDMSEGNNNELFVCACASSVVANGIVFGQVVCSGDIVPLEEPFRLD